MIGILFLLIIVWPGCARLRPELYENNKLVVHTGVLGVLCGVALGLVLDAFFGTFVLNNTLWVLGGPAAVWLTTSRRHGNA